VCVAISLRTSWGCTSSSEFCGIFFDAQVSVTLLLHWDGCFGESAFNLVVCQIYELIFLGEIINI
jgi:hypothetical protein